MYLPAFMLDILSSFFSGCSCRSLGASHLTQQCCMHALYTFTCIKWHLGFLFKFLILEITPVASEEPELLWCMCMGLFQGLYADHFRLLQMSNTDTLKDSVALLPTSSLCFLGIELLIYKSHRHQI